MICIRCLTESNVHTMSRFNTDDICPDCEAREKAHPKYREAYDAEAAAVRSGDMNYAGNGCPPELYIAAAKGDPYVKGVATADFLPDGMEFDCYSNGVRWNGYGCPAFEMAEALKLCAVTDLGLSYNGKLDQFECRTRFSDDSMLKFSSAVLSWWMESLSWFTTSELGLGLGTK